ncbi:nitroreductase family protein [Bacillaceae bacterium Marseille-Q3522]|nr:nitroreductase family protein [Bacillaceae bacterium Marseille-Q3522]
MSKSFAQAIEERRSYYGITKESPIADEKIVELVHHAVKHTPSAFNSQSARAVVLLGEQSDKVWNITEDALKKVVPADSFSSTAEKIASFRSGYGTVLFFEDQTVVEGLQKQFALYADNFPVWSNQSNGMLQLVVWTALEEAGFGASLQHYNPLIDEAVQKEWDIPSSWKLIAEIPFGKPAAEPGEKQFQPIAERVKVFK